MRLRLKTKSTLTTALFVLVAVALISAFYLASLTGLVIAEARRGARLAAQQVYLQAQQAVIDASEAGHAPASDSLNDLRLFVKEALDANAGLTSLIDSSVGYSPSIYEVSIVDHRGIVLISSDPSMPSSAAFTRPPLSGLADAPFHQQIRILYGPPRVYEYALPFKVAEYPFGEVRVGLQTALLRNQIAPGLKIAAWIALGIVVFTSALAALISHLSLRPLARISDQLDRIARGEFEPAAAAAAAASLDARGDEFGQVSTKISRIGEQLRGVQEIFSTLRENIEHVMAGMDDGLILFTRDARAVLVSPSVGKFLGVPRESLLGRRVGEIFPAGHPLQRALGIAGDQLRPVDAVEVEQDAGSGSSVSRMSVNVHVVADRASPGAMGALVTLRDLDSFERLGSNLAASERLSALGRVTAGVAHEVKNPLNAMSTWLAVLKAKLPAAADAPPEVREALGVLESEIHRLDRVVKTFLDFARPVEPDFAEVPLPALLEEVAAIARPQCQRAAVELALTLPTEPSQVLADRQLLIQAILNLLLNAVEAISGVPSSPSRGKGRVEIRLALAGENAEIRVADNGPGIPPEKQARVFQLFFTTRKGGTGIGLATAYRIVQLHGGSIDFVSTSRGTIFRIQLPRVPVRGRGETPVAAASSTSAGRAAP